MEIYDSLLKAVHDEYDTLRVLKKSAWGEVSLVRHRESGTRYIFRHFEGSSEVYQLVYGYGKGWYGWSVTLVNENGWRITNIEWQ